jgi:hypothetical protein
MSNCPHTHHDITERKFYDYKARAEVPHDVAGMLSQFLEDEICVDKLSYTCDWKNLRGPDVEFRAEAKIETLRNSLAKVDDAHVLLESLNYANAYTGKRYYSHEQ